MEYITINKPRHTVVRSHPTVSAVVALPKRRYELFFRVSQGPLAEGSEAFVLAALLPAMKVGFPMYVDGSVSARFLRRVMRLQEFFASRHPEFRVVPILVETRPTMGTPAQGIGCFFSGGVDSFYSVLKLHDELTRLIFVHGFDIPLAKMRLRQNIATNIRQAAHELGKRLIEVETNIRDLMDSYCNWLHHANGIALASVAHVLALHLHTVYVAAGSSYGDMRSIAVNPLLFFLCSISELEIINHGREAYRFDKIAHLIASDVALRYLRVCWENRNNAYNCGQCTKCLHTMVQLHLLGALERCQTFNHSIDLAALRRVSVKMPTERRALLQALEFAEQKGSEPELVEALRYCLGRIEGENELQGRLYHAEARQRELEAEIRCIKASQSWRLTAPLRFLENAAASLFTSFPLWKRRERRDRATESIAQHI